MNRLDDLLFFVNAADLSKDSLKKLMEENENIKYASLVGIDLQGHDTDEKIPMRKLLDQSDELFNGRPLLQTDGSSISLGIAKLNDAKIDMVPDLSSKWFVDYNWENIDEKTELPVGTLRIPSFLMHNNEYICSRSIARIIKEGYEEKIIELIDKNRSVFSHLIAADEKIEKIELTIGTEIEFWVKTPAKESEIEELQVAQMMQENYWQRTKGSVRTALENSLEILDRYGLHPEMGHKEVGGVKASIGSDGSLSYVMEQVEIDWKFDSLLNALDNEIIARIAIKEIFRINGLEASFKAKPIKGVAGNGEHVHVGVQAILNSGKRVNLFSPSDKKNEYLSSFGYGSLMGILKNYEFINPFVSSTNDSLNRLKPGFEAPVCIVCSLGNTPEIPSRNRTVLIGLISDEENELARRFEIRSPNPHTNLYLAVSAVIIGMLEGVEYAIVNKKTEEQLRNSLSKTCGVKDEYLLEGRMYRSEENIFEDYSQEERDRFFGKAPATVWENVKNLYVEEAIKFFTGNSFFKAKNITGFADLTINKWVIELSQRRLAEKAAVMRKMLKLHDEHTGNSLDDNRWKEIENMKRNIMKDDDGFISTFSKINEAIDKNDYEVVSNLEKELVENYEEVKSKYQVYKRNII